MEIENILTTELNGNSKYGNHNNTKAQAGSHIA